MYGRLTSIFVSVVIFDFRDRRERYLDNCSVRAFDFYARRGEGLSGFHAANDSTHAAAIYSDHFNIVLTVKRLECRESFCDFHSFFLLTILESGEYLRFCT